MSFDNSINIVTFSIGGFVLTLLLIFNFIVPTEILPRSLLITIFSLIPFIILLIKIKLDNKLIVFLFLLFSFALLSKNFQNILNVYYLFLFQLLVQKYKDGISFDIRNRKLIYIGGLSLTLQLLYYSKTYILEDGRTGLGTDPNFSGLIILLFFYFSRKLNAYILLIPIIIAIIVLQSRTLLISILIFLTIEYLSNTNFVKYICKVFNPFVIIILVNILFFLFSAFLISVVSFKQNETSNISGRILNITDKSNAGRLAANVFWSAKVINGDYLFKSEDLEEKEYDIKAIIMPHNSLLNLLISSTSLFGFVYLLYFSFLIKPLIKVSNMSYFLSYLFYTLFLHGLFNSIYLFPFLITFLLNPIKNTNKISQ